MMQKRSIMIVDDDFRTLKSLKLTLELNGYNTDTYANPFDAQKAFRESHYNCVLLDVYMPGMDGLELLKQILSTKKSPPVIMISGESNIDTAVESIKLGAYDFFEKPIVSPGRLLVSIRNAIQRQILLEEKEQLSHELETNYRMIGNSAEMQKIYATVNTVAATDAKILITGESGTGKELVARAIFMHSRRKSKPFVSVNCAAIPAELLEMELFGHEKGAFTGAVKEHKGKFLQADGGTIFLDEIGDMAPNLQAKILRVLQDREVNRLGDQKTYEVDVRIITATNKNLEEMVEQGTFREDLYHRLNVVNIRIPPLRQRPDDIIPLALHFLAKFSAENNKAVTGIDLQAQAYLQNYSWPGNARELRNIVEKLVIFARSPEIHLTDVHEAFNVHNERNTSSVDTKTSLSSKDLRSTIEYYEKNHIIKILEENNGRINETAKVLGIDRITLYKKRQKYGI